MAFSNKKQPNRSPSNSSEAKNPKGNSKPNEALFPTAAKYAKRRKQKKIALVFVCAGGVGISCLSILAFLGRSSGQFTIKMEPLLNSAGLEMSETKDGNSTTHLLAPGLVSAKCDTASDVLDYIDSIPVDELSGSQNKMYGGTETTGTSEYALVYTFFVRNIAADPMRFLMTLNLEDYVEPTNVASQPYSYMRIALFENDANANTNANFDVYGLRTLDGSGTAFNPDDRRECLSTYSRLGNIRTPTYTYDGAHGYCKDFESESVIFSRDTTLQPYSSNRFTIVMWAEGNDKECLGQPPQGSSFTCSMNLSAL